LEQFKDKNGKYPLQQLGNSLATTWQQLGNDLATAWQQLDNSLATAWQQLGNSLATARQQLDVEVYYDYSNAYPDDKQSHLFRLCHTWHDGPPLARIWENPLSCHKCHEGIHNGEPDLDYDFDLKHLGFNYFLPGVTLQKDARYQQ
jgi:Flp pilus assembly pilin Flp